MKKILWILVLAIAAYSGWMHFKSGDPVKRAADMSETEIRALAATVQADQVVMYSTPECPYCNQAKAWLKRYGFAYTDCNMRAELHCEREFKASGADGTPFLVISRNGQTHYMKDGFDSEEFLTVLQ